MQGFHYVYILVSANDPTRHYTGHTSELASRLKSHTRQRAAHGDTKPQLLFAHEIEPVPSKLT